jgi:hypothetical protein
MESLHLVTADGQVLTLKPPAFHAEVGPRYLLYQEFSPITPRVVSTLDPREFGAKITNSNRRVSLPSLVFRELKLSHLYDDPEAADTGNLPYANLKHLRRLPTRAEIKV